jgi:hypothetical protein
LWSCFDGGQLGHVHSHWLPYYSCQCNDGHGLVLMEISDGQKRLDGASAKVISTACCSNLYPGHALRAA